MGRHTGGIRAGAVNPHLNLLCLTTDARYVPTDADACRALKLRPSARIVPRPR